MHGRYITWVGRTSIEVALRVEAFADGRAAADQRRIFRLCSARRKPAPGPVPPLLLDSEQALVDFEAGEARHQRRLAAAGRR